MIDRRLANLGCLSFVVELALVLALAWFAGVRLAMIAVAVAFVTRLLCRVIAGPPRFMTADREPEAASRE